MHHLFLLDININFSLSKYCDGTSLSLLTGGEVHCPISLHENGMKVIASLAEFPFMYRSK